MVRNVTNIVRWGAPGLLLCLIALRTSVWMVMWSKQRQEPNHHYVACTIVWKASFGSNSRQCRWRLCECGICEEIAAVLVSGLLDQRWEIKLCQRVNPAFFATVNLEIRRQVLSSLRHRFVTGKSRGDQAGDGSVDPSSSVETTLEYPQIRLYVLLIILWSPDQQSERLSNRWWKFEKAGFMVNVDNGTVATTKILISVIEAVAHQASGLYEVRAIGRA